MTGQWILVANEEAVNIYTKAVGSPKLNLFIKILNPLGRERRRALIRKQAGMGVRSIGHLGVARHSESKRNDPKEMASIQFAKKVSDILYSEKQKKSFDSLIVVAEPHFLGKLKAEMNSSLKSVVSQWVRKDLQKMPSRELSKILLPQENFRQSRETNQERRG